MPKSLSLLQQSRQNLKDLDLFRKGRLTRMKQGGERARYFQELLQRIRDYLEV